MGSAWMGRISRAEMKASDFSRQLFLVAEQDEQSEAEPVFCLFEQINCRGIVGLVSKAPLCCGVCSASWIAIMTGY